jgi:hypothetical protein
MLFTISLDLFLFLKHLLAKMKIKPQITIVLAAVAATAFAILPFDELLFDTAISP